MSVHSLLQCILQCLPFIYNIISFVLRSMYMSQFLYIFGKKDLDAKTLNNSNTYITTIYSVVALYILDKLKH